MKSKFMLIFLILVISAGVLFSLPGFTGAAGAHAADQRDTVVNWIQRYPEKYPSPRRGHAMAYDSARRVTVLFGGSDDKRILGDTWEWDGTAWIQCFPTNSPPSLVDSAMAYDSERKVTVLFGGYPYSDNTWEWDGTDWTRRFPENFPSSRRQHAMAYDRARGVTLMFGGYIKSGADTVPLDDTWEWDGTDWKQWFPTNSPPAQSRHATAYDSEREVTVLFGGDNTWEWNGMVWLQRFPTNSPPAQSDHAMAYDSERQVTILFGKFSQTWEWNGMDWLQRAPASKPSMRDGHALAYDQDRGVTVLFGGYYFAYSISDGKYYKTWYGETWEYGVVSAPDPDPTPIPTPDPDPTPIPTPDPDGQKLFLPLILH